MLNAPSTSPSGPGTDTLSAQTDALFPMAPIPESHIPLAKNPDTIAFVGTKGYGVCSHVLREASDVFQGRLFGSPDKTLYIEGDEEAIGTILKALHSHERLDIDRLKAESFLSLVTHCVKYDCRVVFEPWISKRIQGLQDGLEVEDYIFHLAAAVHFGNEDDSNMAFRKAIINCPSNAAVKASRMHPVVRSLLPPNWECKCKI